jgi:hypothetical protein
MRVHNVVVRYKVPPAYMSAHQRTLPIVLSVNRLAGVVMASRCRSNHTRDAIIRCIPPLHQQANFGYDGPDEPETLVWHFLLWIVCYLDG